MIIPAAGVVIAGRYELTRPLARGGMGSVWIARHRELDVLVAVKFMAHALITEGDARARFEREAKAAAQIDSRHVVQVHDYGVEHDTPYIAMELLKGEDLAQRLKREQRLSVGVMAGLLNQAVKALRKAHEMGIIHRDLKPGNIFLAQKDEEEVVKLLDFGIAKASGVGLVGEVTKTGTLLGSVHFMSPEQARGSKEVDHRSDLWSLAVIMFRALTGKLPFAGHDIGDVIVKICAEPVPLASQITPDLPKEIDHFFERGLARQPARRFQSAREMAEAFHALAGGAPPFATLFAANAVHSGWGDWIHEREVAFAQPPAAIVSSGDRPSPEPTTLEIRKDHLPMQAAQEVQPREPAHSGHSFTSGPIGTLAPTHETLGAPDGSRRRVTLWVAGGGAAAFSLSALLVLGNLLSGKAGPKIASITPVSSATASSHEEHPAALEAPPPSPEARPSALEGQPSRPDAPLPPALEAPPASPETQPSPRETQTPPPVQSSAIIPPDVNVASATPSSLSAPRSAATSLPAGKKTREPSSAVPARSEPVALPSPPGVKTQPATSEKKIELP